MRLLSNDMSSLGFGIIKIYHKGDKYIKFKAHLVNRFNGYIYETKNYKMCKSAFGRLKWVSFRL